MPNRQDEAASFTSRNPWVPAPPHDLREDYNRSPTRRLANLRRALTPKAALLQCNATYIEWYMDSAFSLKD
jgi:hypothetical protein